MKIIIIGGVAEGKTVFARALQELCKEHFIDVVVSDPDFSADGKEFGSLFNDPAAVDMRLHALGTKGTKVEITTFQLNRHGVLPSKDCLGNPIPVTLAEIVDKK